MVNPRAPLWLHELAARADDGALPRLSRHAAPDAIEARRSAVLMLFGSVGDGTPSGHGDLDRTTTPDAGHGADSSDVDVLIIERAHTLRSHPGQPAFPGGAIDPEDAGPVDAALREAVEETGLERNGVDVMAAFPDLWLPPSGFVVRPVLAWWREPSPVDVMDPAEVASVHRVPVAELVNPDHRLRVRHWSGYVGPAFKVRGLLVWGFTAGILSALLETAGLALPWDRNRVEDLPEIPRVRVTG